MARPLTLPRLLLFVPGTLFWVLVGVGIANEDPLLIQIAVCLFFVVAATVIITKLRASRRTRADLHRVWMEGQPARATVVAISTTGASLNDHPLVDLELDVDVDGAAPYRTTVQSLVSLLAIPRVQPACEIGVHVDRTDRRRVVIDASLTPYGYRV